jgi:hypothetical protein
VDAPLKYVGVVIVMVLAVAPPSRAASFDASFLNSNLTFAGATFDHSGHDLYILNIDGIDYLADFLDTEFTASGGALVQTTPVFDGSGTLIRTEYRYEGGTLSIDFRRPGFVHAGLYTAPIVSLLVSAAEPLDPYFDGGESGVLPQYVLGPGAFDDAIASVLGIQKAAGAGSGAGSLLLLFGDHQSPELVADDGLIDFSANPAAIPEPSLSVLAGLGLLAALRSRGRR